MTSRQKDNDKAEIRTCAFKESNKLVTEITYRFKSGIGDPFPHFIHFKTKEM